MYIFDLHCDTLDRLYQNPYQTFFKNSGHISELSLRLGGYAAQCFAVYQPSDIKAEYGYAFFRKQYNSFNNILCSSRILKPAKSQRDILRNIRCNKISAILTVENADFLNNDLKKLKIAERLGVTVLGLIHNGENCLGYPNSHDGAVHSLPLKKFGRKVIDYLNSTNITADVSHLNEGGFNDVAAISKKPFIATHSACRELYDHPRNLYDRQIRKIADSGGVVGMAFYSRFLNGSDTTEISDIIRHLSHLIKVGGQDIAAFGSDFDGMNCNLFLKDASGMPYLADALIKEFGFSVAEKICFKNALRIF